MVLVTMEAHVLQEQWDALARAFTHAMEHRPDGVLLSLLTHETHDPTLWRIMTAWESREALDAYYQSNTTLLGAYIFHVIGVVPVASLSEVVRYA